MAEIKYLSNISLEQNELLWPRIQNLTAAPTTGNPTGAPLEGQLYMNSVNHNLYVYDGTGWVDLTNTAYTFTLTADTGGSTSITDGTTVDIAGGSGLASTISTSTVTIDLDISTLGAPVGGIVDADSLLVYDTSGAVHTIITASALKTYINAAAGTFSSFDIAGDTGTDTITDAETVTFTGGTGIVTAVTTGVVTYTLDFTELTDMVASISGTTEFILNNAGVESRKAASEIGLQFFDNTTSGFTTNTGTVTSVGAGTGLNITGTATVNPTVNLALNALAEKTGDLVGTDRLTGVSGTTHFSETISTIPLSIFSNDSGWTSNTGTVTSVAAGNGMNFTAITGSGSVILGTPSTLTSSTTNAVTTNSHTHAIDISGFASTALSDTANIVYTNVARNIAVTHTVLTGSKLTLVDLPSAGTDAANKNYVDSVLATNDAMIFKGTVGTGGTLTIAAFNSLAVYDAGWTYKIIEAGTVKGNVVEIGDMIIATVDRASAGVNADWVVVQSNLDGAVIGPASATDSAIALFDGTTGKLIKNSSTALGSFIPVSGATTQILQYASAGTAKWVTLSSDVTIADGGAVTIGNNRVTYAKIQQSSVGYTVLGKATTAAGNFAEIVAGTDGVLRRSGTGDLAFGSLVTNNLGNNIVTYAKIQTMATQTFLGRNTAGTGNVEALTVAQVRTLLGIPTGGVVNASETVSGIVEEATQAEVTAGTATGSTGAQLFVTPAKLRTDLGTVGAEAAVIRRKSATCTATTSTTVTHNFNTRNVIVQVYRTATPWDMVMTEVKMTTVNTVDVNFNTAPLAGEYTIVVMG